MSKIAKASYMLVILVALTFGFSLGQISSIFATDQNQPADSFLVDQQTGLTFNAIYEAVSPSVVAINVATMRGGQVLALGTGSGFVIDKAGHIVTNEHVVSNATRIDVEFYDGTLASAEIVGLDADSDLAVLVVDMPSEKLVPVRFGNSDALVVGETVLAIGSPYGQDWTLTAGIVSGLDRVIGGLTRFSIGAVIQTDAAINPGNSGGTLLNLQGEVVGVNAQIMTESGSNSGVGFAIPSNLVQHVAQELITDGKADYSYVGISGSDVNLALLEELNLPNNIRGIVVSDVVNGGPAHNAGLRGMQRNGNRFDIITAINGHTIKGMDDMITYLARNTQPGQTIELTVLRNGAESQQVEVKLTSRP